MRAPASPLLLWAGGTGWNEARMQVGADAGEVVVRSFMGGRLEEGHGGGGRSGAECGGAHGEARATRRRDALP